MVLMNSGGTTAVFYSVVLFFLAGGGSLGFPHPQRQLTAALSGLQC